jgi:putative sterol carrier protein
MVWSFARCIGSANAHPLARSTIFVGQSISADFLFGGNSVAQYLSQEWHDRARELAQSFPERPGASARMAYLVTGAPGGDFKYFQITVDGKVTEQAIGACEAPDFTLTVSWDDSMKVQRGELDPNAAFMQGRMKVSGNMGKLMALMPLTMSPEYRQIQEQIRALTEYPD